MQTLPQMSHRSRMHVWQIAQVSPQTTQLETRLSTQFARLAARISAQVSSQLEEQEACLSSQVAEQDKIKVETDDSLQKDPELQGVMG